MGIDFDENPVAPIPAKLGLTVIDSVSLEDIVPFIDWNPFFQTWELRGRYPNRGYPKIFNDARVGEEAKKLFDDAQAMIKKILDENLLSVKGIVGMFPANSVGDDVEIYEDDERSTVSAKFCMLRQQMEKENKDDPYMCQSDFIAPKGTGLKDYMGMFAVACFGCDEQCAKYEADNDDYSKIMMQALADRFAEAFAEAMHRDIRLEHWGYSKENFTTAEDLIRMKYS